MKIGVIISNLFRLPPKAKEIIKGYSGAPENIGWQITENLVKRGHNVTLFASGDSKTSARLVPVAPVASALDPTIGIKNHINFEYYLISAAIQETKRVKFDLVHSHIPSRTAIFARHFPCPVVATLHSPLISDDKILLDNKNAQYYVSISNSQRKPLPQLNYLSTIYHGIDFQKIPFSDSDYSDRMSFSGRIVPGKGLHSALKAARQMEKNIDIYGDVPEEQREYFREQITSQLTGKDKIYGFQPQDIVWQGIRKSRVMLFPIEIEEPFGLVMIEAMACGTPVIAFRRGSVPEVVKNGVTGFIVEPDDIQGLVNAVKKIYSLPEQEYQKMRRACRKYVEKYFTIQKMINGYEKVYQRIIQQWSQKKNIKR